MYPWLLFAHLLGVVSWPVLSDRPQSAPPLPTAPRA
jgi:hypothetical protein